MAEQTGPCDTKFVLSAGAVLALVTTLPYLLGAVLSSPDMRFSGFLLGQEDGYSYMCKMLQGYQGSWVFHLYYSPEPHYGGLFFLFYLLLGKLAWLTGAPLIVVFHMSRVLLIPVGLYAFYRLARYLLPRAEVCRLAVLLLAFGAGLGWLWACLGLPTALGDMPVDLWAPDISYFLSAITFPHLVLGLALLFGFILFTLRYLDAGSWRDALWAILTGLGASLVHPYKLPVIAVPLAVYVLWRIWKDRRSAGRLLLRLIVVFAPSAVYVIYAWLVFEMNSTFAEWQAQNLVYSPPIHLYVLGLGIPLILAVAGLIWGEYRASRHPFLVIWFLVIPPLLYVPHPIQRRFIDGYQAPIAILTASGLYVLYRLFPHQRWRAALTALLAIPIVLSNVLLLLGAVSSAASPREPIYRPAWEIDAVHWFWADPTYPVVLSSYASGNLLPGSAPVRSFVGHGSETLDKAGKVQLVDEFFSAVQTDAWREELLREYDVRYVYYGPHERDIGSFDPASMSGLAQVYDNGTVEIYRVE